ncbi:hypothetical protein FSZ17_15790 [Cytobacillus dafuensis]|uniref:Uncharacterized protein n=1 Tax=Cytobacillus dafuensis TaxID=1742359 RepID=A0A5B8Z6L3_CYTDA|nr:hypothetical protein FSZ17_15790 [Cytobacillus dafuensis]
MNNTIFITPYESKYQSEVVDLIVHIQQKEYNLPITKEEQPDLLEIEGIKRTSYIIAGDLVDSYYMSKILKCT